MATLGNAVVNIRANLTPLKRGLAAARSAVTKGLRAMNRRVLAGMRRGFVRLASAVTRLAKILSVAFVAAVVASVKVAADFQRQMQFVNTMLSEDAQPILEEYTKTVRMMSVEFAQSTDTLTKALFDILSASIDASKAVDVLRVATKLAVAGQSEAGVVAKLLVSIINSYGLAAEDAAEISDKLFATVKRGLLTFPELASSLGRVAATASVAGLSLDELLAAIATVTRGGINAAETMTSLNALMQAFIKPQDNAKKAAKEFGLELSSNTLQTIGLVGAIQKLNGATAEQLTQIVPRIRGFKAIARATQDVAGLMKDFQLISQESAGRTQEAFDKMTSALGFRFGQVKQLIIDTGRELGLALSGPAGRFADLLFDRFEILRQIFKENPRLINELGDAFVNVIKRILGFVDKFIEDIQTKGIKQTLVDMFWDAFDAVVDVVKRAWAKIRTRMEDEISRFTQLIIKGLTFILIKVTPVVIDIGLQIGTALVNGVRQGIEAEMDKLPAILKLPFKTMRALDISKFIIGPTGAQQRVTGLEQGRAFIQQTRRIGEP